MTLKTQLSSALLLCISLYSYSKERDSSKVKKEELLYQTLLSAGAGLGTYRDFATSPLFYAGPSAFIASGAIKRNEVREKGFELAVTGVFSSSLTPQSDFFQVFNFGTLVALNANYFYLRKINAVKMDKTALWAGGMLQASQNIRVNPELDNSSIGVEGFMHLMAMAKLERDISRTSEKELDFIIFKKTLKPISRKLSFESTVGLLNFNHRPSYNYVYDSEINGTETGVLPYLFSGYSWTMNGYRWGTKIEFSKFRKNGNGEKLAYVWDMLHAPGKFESFQMAFHRIQYTLVINSKRD